MGYDDRGGSAPARARARDSTQACPSRQRKSACPRAVLLGGPQGGELLHGLRLGLLCVGEAGLELLLHLLQDAEDLAASGPGPRVREGRAEAPPEWGESDNVMPTQGFWNTPRLSHAQD